MVIDEWLENVEQEINIPRVGTLQLLCLRKLSKEVAYKEDWDVFTVKGKEIISNDKIECFRQKKRFFDRVFIN